MIGSSVGGSVCSSAIMRLTPLVGVDHTWHSLTVNNSPRAAERKRSISGGGRISEKCPSLAKRRFTPLTNSSNGSVAVWRAVERAASGDSFESMKYGGLDIMQSNFCAGEKSCKALCITSIRSGHGDAATFSRACNTQSSSMSIAVILSFCYVVPPLWQ